MPASALPAVSFLKAPGYEDGHAGYSDPADEQRFVVTKINALERTPDWASTVVIVAYDDSDGWYDHVYSGVHNPSLSPADNLTDTTLSGPTSGKCGPSPQTAAPLGGEQGRCGFGPRLPLLVISPLARPTPSITRSQTRPRSSIWSSTTGACPGSRARPIMCWRPRTPARGSVRPRRDVQLPALEGPAAAVPEPGHRSTPGLSLTPGERLSARRSPGEALRRRGRSVGARRFPRRGAPLSSRARSALVSLGHDATGARVIENARARRVAFSPQSALTPGTG